MKKKAKKRLPGSKVKKQRKFTRKKQRQQIQYGIGQKMINSVVIALDEDDKIHVRKIVEGLDEYDLARLIEALDFNHRRRLVEILGDHIDPEVFPELNEIVQEQVIETLDEGQIVNIVMSWIPTTRSKFWNIWTIRNRSPLSNSWIRN